MIEAPVTSQPKRALLLTGQGVKPNEISAGYAVVLRAREALTNMYMSTTQAAFDRIARLRGESPVSLSTILTDPNSPELTEPRVILPAIFTIQRAALQIAEMRGYSLENLNIQAIAGFSGGEGTALYIAGVIPRFGRAAEFMAFRGSVMQSFCGPKSKLVGVMGLNPEEILSLCDSEKGRYLAISCTPNFSVMGGEVGKLEGLEEAAKAKGAKRIIDIPTFAAFHTPLMLRAADALYEFIADDNFRNASLPVISTLNARSSKNARELINNHIECMTNPVRWSELIQALIDTGITEAIEVGPGSTLAGFNKGRIPTTHIFDLIAA